MYLQRVTFMHIVHVLGPWFKYKRSEQGQALLATSVAFSSEKKVLTHCDSDVAPGPPVFCFVVGQRSQLF